MKIVILSDFGNFGWDLLLMTMISFLIIIIVIIYNMMKRKREGTLAFTRLYIEMTISFVLLVLVLWYFIFRP